jgi:GT2 family glycosyltransferase
VGCSVEDDISICVGTVRRPYCIQRFINSVRANFPRIQIVVGDQDKPNSYLHAFYEAAGAKVVYVAEDSGVGVARHAAIAQVQTEYILFYDDDFVFSSETRLNAPLQILERDREVDIVGGQVRDLIGRIDAQFSAIRRWEHFFALDRKQRILLTANIDSFSPKRREVDGIPYFFADRVLNWKLVRKSAFERGAPWDPRFKCNGEHDDFYLNIKENTDIKVAYCPDFRVYHHSPEDYSYSVKREDQEGVRKFGEKWGIDEVVDADAEPTRMILARGFIHTPQDETADPGLDEARFRRPGGQSGFRPVTSRDLARIAMLGGAVQTVGRASGVFSKRGERRRHQGRLKVQPVGCGREYIGSPHRLPGGNGAEPLIQGETQAWLCRR